MSEVRRFADAEALAEAGADEFAKLVREAIARGGRACVALSGGSTPRRMYELLADERRRSQVEWEHVELFWGDERAVPPEHADSNYGMAARLLLPALSVRPSHVHRIKGELPDLDQAAREYQSEIARVFGVSESGPPPTFDLIFLGMGSEGHTASLFPHSEALHERLRWVVSSVAPHAPAGRITLTPPILNRAREVRLLVAGSDKTTILRDVIEGPRDCERLPVQLLRPDCGRLVWLVDAAASAALGTSP